MLLTTENEPMERLNLVMSRGSSIIRVMSRHCRRKEEDQRPRSKSQRLGDASPFRDALTHLSQFWTDLSKLPNLAACGGPIRCFRIASGHPQPCALVPCLLRASLPFQPASIFPKRHLRQRLFASKQGTIAAGIEGEHQLCVCQHINQRRHVNVHSGHTARPGWSATLVASSTCGLRPPTQRRA